MLCTTNSGSSYNGRRYGLASVSAGTVTVWMMVSSVAPAFIIATTSATRSSSAVATSPSTVAIRSLPSMGRPCAGSSSSAPRAAISRRAAAHSIG